MANKVAVKQMFTARFTSPNPRLWGGKGFVICAVAQQASISQAEARRIFNEWVNEQESK